MLNALHLAQAGYANAVHPDTLDLDRHLRPGSGSRRIFRLRVGTVGHARRISLLPFSSPVNCAVDGFMSSSLSSPHPARPG